MFAADYLDAVAYTYNRVIARKSLKRSRDFSCPCCGKEVTLKKPRSETRRAHFSHLPKTRCFHGRRPASLDHAVAQTYLQNAYNAIGVQCLTEFTLGTRRPDLVIWTPCGNRVAIELQKSNIYADRLAARAADISATGAGQCWIPMQERPAFLGIRDGLLVMAERSKNDVVAWVNGCHFGRGFWLFSIGEGGFFPVRLAKRYEDFSAYDGREVDNIRNSLLHTFEEFVSVPLAFVHRGEVNPKFPDFPIGLYVDSARPAGLNRLAGREAAA
jgi:hypothetical protein